MNEFRCSSHAIPSRPSTQDKIEMGTSTRPLKAGKNWCPISSFSGRRASREIEIQINVGIPPSPEMEQRIVISFLFGGLPIRARICVESWICGVSEPVVLRIVIEWSCDRLRASGGLWGLSACNCVTRRTRRDKAWNWYSEGMPVNDNGREFVTFPKFI